MTDIATLNDTFRKTLSGGRVMLTAGINAMSQDDVAQILSRVRSFNDFTPDNNPYNEHDFFCFDYKGNNIFCKIDYYDKNLQYLSEDPADTSKTIRVMTIMLADEYAINRKYKLARDSYRKALKNEPDNADALFGYAQMSYYMDDLKTSQRTLEQLLNKDSENAPALYFMGKLAAEDSNYIRASSFVKKAVSEFLNLHKNKTSLEKALFELDEYWKGIYDTMIVIQAENKKLTTEIEKLRTIVTDNEEIKMQSEKVENENRGLTVENRYLKKMLRTYLYPEVAERIINDKAETMTSVNAERLPEYADTDEVPGSFDAAIKHDTALKRDKNILISRIRRLCDEEQ